MADQIKLRIQTESGERQIELSEWKNVNAAELGGVYYIHLTKDGEDGPKAFNKAGGLFFIRKQRLVLGTNEAEELYGIGAADGDGTIFIRWYTDDFAGIETERRGAAECGFGLKAVSFPNSSGS